MKFWILFCLVCSLSVLSSCKKDDNSQKISAATPKLSFQLKYEVDGQMVYTDTILYSTAAGYPYSIVTLYYYLSQISLIKSDGTPVLVKDYQYASFLDATTNFFSVYSPPKGSYSGIRFNIGIDAAHNVPDSLPANSDNNNMIWPLFMGGGFHFLKFEGKFSDSMGTYGFAMHLGKNQNLVTVILDKNFTIGDSDVLLGLTMNLNKWFQNPYNYDFIIDGNYSMSNPDAMTKLSVNGKDVFHF